MNGVRRDEPFLIGDDVSTAQSKTLLSNRVSSPSRVFEAFPIPIPPRSPRSPRSPRQSIPARTADSKTHRALFSPSLRTSPQHERDVQRAIPVPSRPQIIGRPAQGPRRNSMDANDNDFSRLRSIADRLRSENMDLCEEVQRRSAQAGPLEATLPAASTPAACHGSPQFLKDGLAALEKLAELNKDLRSAVQRSVEQRMQVERRHSAVKVEHSR